MTRMFIAVCIIADSCQAFILTFDSLDYLLTATLFLNWLEIEHYGDISGILLTKPHFSSKCLVVLHDGKGINMDIFNFSSTIIEKGDFDILMPDLYSGNLPDVKEDNNTFIGGLNLTEVMYVIEAATNYLLYTHGCTEVGITGIGTGGALSLAAGELMDGLSAAATFYFYGVPGDDLYDLTNRTIPVQAHIVVSDEVKGYSTSKDVKKLKTKLEVSGVEFELITYDADSAFMDPIRAQAVDRFVTFMNKYLHVA